MSNQLQATGAVKVRSLTGVITGTTGVLGSLPINGSLGIPQLDVNGKILVSQLPNSVMEYKGTWSAITNTPTLTDGTGNQGDVYLCNAAATTGTSVNFGSGAIVFYVGDQVIYSGTIWQRASGASGTVTSVAVSRSGDALSITGSPITTSGTINLGFAGNSGQYINGAGNLTTFPTLITEAQTLITDVYNETGATLTKGTVVYINGGHGNLPTVTKALATSDATSAQTYGVVQADITNMNNGHVVVIGSLGDLDTQAYANGTILYLSSTTAGAWTSTKQYAPAHLVYVGIVVRSHPTQGVVEIKIQNGYELDELHNVSAQSPLNNQGIFYNTSTSLWENKSIATALGYTPANAALYVPYTGATTDLNLGANLLKFTTEASDNASIGTTVSGASSYFDFNLSDDNNQEEWRFRFTPSGGSVYDAVRIRPVSATKSDLLVSGDIGASNFSGSSGGTNTGDVTIGTANGLSLASQVLSLATSSASTTGALTSTDWSSFNSKVSSQWTTSGSDIYYNTGNVCVNTTTSGTGRFFVAANNDSGITIRNTGTSDRFQLFVGSTGGSTYTADNAIIKGTNTAIDFYNGSTATKKVTIPNSGNYLEVYGDAYVQSYVKIGNGTGNYTALTTIASGTKIVTFPNAAGTVALTSDIPSLTGYVPYTGATTNLDMGANGLYANNLTIRKISTSATIDFPNTGTMNDPAYIKHTESPDNTGVMSFSVGDNDATNDYFVFGNTSSGFVERFKITATGVVTIGTWNGTAIGDSYISSAATWNAKQSAITLTTTGSSGAATFVSNTLNIPNYGSALSSYVPYTGATASLEMGNGSLGIQAGQFLLFNRAGSNTLGSSAYQGFLDAAQANGVYFQLNASNNLGIFGKVSGAITLVASISATGNFSGVAGSFTSTLNVGTTAYITNDAYIGDTTSGTGRFIITDSSNQGITLRRTGATGDRFKMFVGNGTTYTQDNCIILGTNTDIDFYTGSSPLRRMTIANNGSVGIGINTPFAISDTNLSVNGATGSAIQLGFNGTRYGQFYADASEIRLSAVANLPLTFYSNNTERMRITSGGNVGIGNTGGSGIRLYVKAQSTSSGDYGLVVTDSTDSNLFYVRNDGLTFIKGNSGSLVQQAGTVGGDVFHEFKNSAGTRRAFLGFGGASSSVFDIWNSENGDMKFATNNTEKMRITSGGNVGIGTNPTYKLDVSGTNGTYIRVAETNGAGGYGAGVRAVSNGTDMGFVVADGSLALYDFGGGGRRLTITSGGNVGIGTSSPSYQLQLSTDSAAKPTSALWTIASDKRIKENINPYKKGLQELLKINPITYDYNGLGGFSKGKGGVGIIAQEIMNILPNTISSIKAKLNHTDEEETDILNFNGHELIYVLINAIKEQQVQIELQDSKIEEFKAEIEILKNK